MKNFVLLIMLMAPQEKSVFTTPRPPAPEYGHGLTEADSGTGWISLFDGKTSYGWQSALVESGTISQGQTTAVLASCELRAEVTSPGELSHADQRYQLDRGAISLLVHTEKLGSFRLGQGLALSSLRVRPQQMKRVFNGQNLNGWKVIPHPRLSPDRQTRWSVENEVLHAKGGPGALQLEGSYGNMLLQIEVRTRSKLVNGGIFFRAIRDDFMNGYEAQIFNACYDHDPGKPARYSTGAIDDRLLARRVVSRDMQPFTMTVLAYAKDISVWVNGFQTVSWTDSRPNDLNPRRGSRTKPGVVQLQAHDPESDLEFSRIRLVELGPPDSGR